MLLTFCFILGLVVGSFLNVCIYRIPRGESIVFPRSHCPQCGKDIPAHHNIPLLAYIWLGGKCSFCKKPISLQYPLVELLTGLIFFGCALKWEFASPTYLNALFLSLIVILIFIDYNHQILPNVITIPGTLVAIALSFLQEKQLYADSISLNLASAVNASNPGAMLPWIGALVGAIISAGTLFLVALVYQLLRKRQGLGMGDVKMMALVGAFLGWRLAFLTIFIGSLVGSIIGLLLILFRGKTLQTKLAFGTFLGMGSLLAVFYGPAVISWYTASL
ncbi:MAG: type 4 prepilin peptidase 1, Aspartic peptidase, family [Acidobacteria bacterium]|jgi:leader peptidase (prepilin peptidase)/N-methyltransferase|nr:type 4 prepilin peptidase 1, Aspartic peptidase, family [Acidobacteriota bacterium]